MAGTYDLQVGVIGSGQMGTDIFYYLFDVGFPLVWVCISEEERKKISMTYEKRLARMLRNGLIDQDVLESRKRSVKISSALADLSGCGIIIEAIHEDEDAKARLFRDLEPLICGDTVVTTNTSSIKPSRLICDSARKDRFAGLHFFYPVRYNNIAELIRTDYTGDRTIRILKGFLSAIARPHLDMHEQDGFILNRIFLDLQAQAFRFFAEGTSMAAIDRAVSDELFPAGVFGFFDAVGLDVMYRSVVNYTEGSRDTEFYRPLIEGLEKLVADGRLGRKSGAGFYDYPRADADDGDRLEVGMRDRLASTLRCLYVNSAFRALEKNICPMEELEHAVREYAGADRGPFALADETGRDAIRSMLLGFHEKTGYEAYRPSKLL